MDSGQIVAGLRYANPTYATTSPKATEAAVATLRMKRSDYTDPISPGQNLQGPMRWSLQMPLPPLSPPYKGGELGILMLR